MSRGSWVSVSAGLPVRACPSCGVPTPQNHHLTSTRLPRKRPNRAPHALKAGPFLAVAVLVVAKRDMGVPFLHLLVEFEKNDILGVHVHRQQLAGAPRIQMF